MARTVEETRAANRKRKVAKYATDPLYRERRRAQSKAWYETHKAEHNVRSKKWGEEHKAKRSEFTKRWKAAHPIEAEEQRRRNLAYRAKNRERLVAKARLRWEQMPPEKRAVALRSFAANDLRRKERAAGRPRPDVCEVCGGKGGKQPIHFDHDHATGLFRGWLCHHCNVILGMARDNADLLLKLATYLEQSQELQATA